MKRIAQDIKDNKFSHLYLLGGDEAYLRKQYRDKLKNALVPDGDTMNCTVYSGKDINVNEVADMAGTMPFFAERRVIIIENSGWMRSPDDKIIDIVKNIPDDFTVFFRVYAIHFTIRKSKAIFIIIGRR